MKRSGTADLPLHGGRVPPWLAERMTQLGTAITECVIQSYGPSEFLTRLSDPFWFQALGAVMGMDWHSSGITTSVMGALQRGLNPRFSDLGFAFCGGRGKHSRRTPAELIAFASRIGLNGDSLARTSRLTARIDNNAISDGFQLYLHSFVIHKSGEWAVIQQGMNEQNRLARLPLALSHGPRLCLRPSHRYLGQTTGNHPQSRRRARRQSTARPARDRARARAHFHRRNPQAHDAGAS